MILLKSFGFSISVKWPDRAVPWEISNLDALTDLSSSTWPSFAGDSMVVMISWCSRKKSGTDVPVGISLQRT
jgi:hypothetical protein|tara:strand:- start:119 stop:334 length:216 start_codon:yes stop_codon:yes gene_type:complete